MGSSHDRRTFKRAVEREVSKRPSSPTMSGQLPLKESKSLWHKLLDFIEHPLFLTPVGIVGGLVGILVYAPVLLICGACILLAFHRAKVVSGQRILQVQVPSYLILSVAIFIVFYSVRMLVDRKLKEANISIPALASEIASDLARILSKSPPNAGNSTSVQVGTPSATGSLKQPLIKRGALSTVIPFVINRYQGGIPYDSNRTDPLFLTYTELAGISYLPIQPTISGADVDSFLGHVMQYYILRTVNEIQNPVTHGSFDTQKGISAYTNSPVSVPNEREYPNDKLFKLFEKLKLRFGPDSGANDGLWKRFKMKVPSGTGINFVEITHAGKTDYIVRFERAPDLLLDFRIETTTRTHAQGIFPKNFVPEHADEIQDTYSYVFTIYVGLQWKGDRSLGQDYVEWANGLEAGLHKRLVIP